MKGIDDNYIHPDWWGPDG